VRITGRWKDVIIPIFVAEIEGVLVRYPHVAHIAVIGLPGERTGERVCAVAAPEQGCTVPLAQLTEHCQGQAIARPTFPAQLEVIPALPRSPMGKIFRQQLGDRFGGQRQLTRGSGSSAVRFMRSNYF
jgi:non-ribosomal peptide synthetase component E (peptide arylation enzyme)